MAAPALRWVQVSFTKLETGHLPAREQREEEIRQYRKKVCGGGGGNGEQGCMHACMGSRRLSLTEFNQLLSDIQVRAMDQPHSQQRIASHGHTHAQTKPCLMVVWRLPSCQAVFFKL